MAQITDEMKDVVLKARAIAIATSSPDGEPNCVVVTFAKVISDDEFLLMDNYMEKTAANLKANPRVAISCWEVNWETRKSRAYQFKGNARFVTSGPLFDEGYQWVKSMMPETDPKAAIIVKIDSIYNLDPHAHQ